MAAQYKNCFPFIKPETLRLSKAWRVDVVFQRERELYNELLPIAQDIHKKKTEELLAKMRRNSTPHKYDHVDIGPGESPIWAILFLCIMLVWFTGCFFNP